MLMKDFSVASCLIPKKRHKVCVDQTASLCFPCDRTAHLGAKILYKYETDLGTTLMLFTGLSAFKIKYIALAIVLSG